VNTIVATRPDISPTAELERLRSTTGYRTLSKVERADFDRLILSDACDGFVVRGGWRAISRAMGRKRRTTFSRWFSEPGEYPLDFTGDPQGARPKWSDRSRTNRNGTPVAPRRMAPLACLPVEVSQDEALVEREEQAGSSSDEEIAGWFEREHGVVGPGKRLLIEALGENRQGVRACFEEAERRGSNPIRLFLTMLRDGDHRIRVYTEPESPYDEHGLCRRCEIHRDDQSRGCVYCAADKISRQ
jgi:hypothetical protein